MWVVLIIIAVFFLGVRFSAAMRRDPLAEQRAAEAAAEAAKPKKKRKPEVEVSVDLKTGEVKGGNGPQFVDTSD